jgi:hypothetical protein
MQHSVDTGTPSYERPESTRIHAKQPLTPVILRYEMHNNNSIQFNSIRVYLRANSTAQRPITE